MIIGKVRCGRGAVVRREWVCTIVFRCQAARRAGVFLRLYFHPLLFVEVFFSFFLFILFHGVSVKSDTIKLSLLSGLNHSLSPRSI